jgi:mannose-1-phosphate guanylyltransferase / mannose-6-phosphate isomerase
MTSQALIQPVILAGGAGTRLWPLSRGDYPKQLLNLDGDGTMLQATAGRLDPLSSSQPTFTIAPAMIVAGEDIRFLVADQVNTGNPAPAAIVLEPIARNTAPAIAAAAYLARRDGADPVLVVMPADHVVRNAQAFCAAVARAVELCLDRDVIATFGIVPSRPETGFGYIRRGTAISSQEDAFELAAFVEKPDLERATKLVADGEHYWNGGIFIARASVLCKAVEGHAPAIGQAVTAAVGEATHDGDFIRLARDGLASSPSDSFDYAVMEKLDESDTVGVGAIVVPLDAGWSDVGSWGALLEVLDADANGNVNQGDVVSIDSRNNIQISTSRLVTSLGIDGLVIVETPDAVFVAPKELSQRVKEVVGELAERKRSEATSHQKVYRPWGVFESLDHGSRYQVKRLTVYPGASLSLQLHHHRAEHWVVVEGTARVTRGDEVILLTENESTYLPVGIKHRLENPGKVALEVIEVQSGTYLGEDDIVRFEDVYRRD